MFCLQVTCKKDATSTDWKLSTPYCSNCPALARHGTTCKTKAGHIWHSMKLTHRHQARVATNGRCEQTKSVALSNWWWRIVRRILPGGYCSATRDITWSGAVWTFQCHLHDVWPSLRKTCLKVTYLKLTLVKPCLWDSVSRPPILIQPETGLFRALLLSGLRDTWIPLLRDRIELKINLPELGYPGDEIISSYWSLKSRDRACWMPTASVSLKKWLVALNWVMHWLQIYEYISI